MAYQPAQSKQAFASAARTATVNSNPISVPWGTGAVKVRVASTAITSTPSVVFKIQGEAPGGVWEDLIASTAVATVTTLTLQVGRGLTAAANTVVNASIPQRIRVRAEHANANSITYSALVEFFG